MEKAGASTEDDHNTPSPQEDQPGTSGSRKGKEKKTRKARYSPQENRNIITEVRETPPTTERHLPRVKWETKMQHGSPSWGR